MHRLSKVDVRVPVISIGVFHLMLVIYGLYITIADLILKEEPVNEDNVFYIIGHVLFQVVLAAFLIVGGALDYPCLVIPWLLGAFPVFVLVTIYTVYYFNLEYAFQTLVNIVVICFFWALWYIVYLFGRSKRNPRRKTRTMFASGPVLPRARNRGAEEDTAEGEKDNLLD